MTTYGYNAELAAGTDIVMNCFGVAATAATQASTYMQGYLIEV